MTSKLLIISMLLIAVICSSFQQPTKKEDRLAYIIDCLEHKVYDRVEYMMTKECEIYLNGIKTKEVGFSPIEKNIDFLYASMSEFRLDLTNKICEDQQWFGEWQLKGVHPETKAFYVVSSGVIIVKLNEDSKITQFSIYNNDVTEIVTTIDATMEIRTSTMSLDEKLAGDKYWFYVRSSSGGFYDKAGFHYSQILKCSQKVTTPGIFSKDNAVGPFDTYAEASTARKDEIDIASKSDLKLIPRQAVCETKWK